MCTKNCKKNTMMATCFCQKTLILISIVYNFFALRNKTFQHIIHFWGISKRIKKLAIRFSNNQKAPMFTSRGSWSSIHKIKMRKIFQIFFHTISNQGQGILSTFLLSKNQISSSLKCTCRPSSFILTDKGPFGIC